MRILILGPQWRNDPIKAFLEGKDHVVELWNEPLALAFALEKKIDLILSSGYPYKVNADVVRRFPDRVINLHATYLPWGKGIGTTLFAFLEGSPKGVSLHFIDEQFDTGDIIARRKVEPAASDTLRTFYQTLLDETEKLFRDSFESILAGTFERIPQKSIPAVVHYHSRVESEKFLDLLPLKWDTPISEVEEMGVELALSENFWQELEAESR